MAEGAIRCTSSGISPKTLIAFKRTAAEAPNRSLVFPVTIRPSSNSSAAAGQESSSARFKHGPTTLLISGVILAWFINSFNL